MLELGILISCSRAHTLHASLFSTTIIKQNLVELGVEISYSSSSLGMNLHQGSYQITGGNLAKLV